MVATKKKPTVTSHDVILEVPMAQHPGQPYMASEVRIRLRTRMEKVTMRRVLDGLQFAGATLADGSSVDSNEKALRFLLQLAQHAWSEE